MSGVFLLKTHLSTDHIMDEEDKPQPKIGLGEFIFVLQIFIISDIIDLIPVAGSITGAIDFLAENIYFKLKGVPMLIGAITGAVDIIPFLDWLPTRTVGYIATYIIDHMPNTYLKTAIESTAQLASTKTAGGGTANLPGGATQFAKAPGVASTTAQTTPAAASFSSSSSTPLASTAGFSSLTSSTAQYPSSISGKNPIQEIKEGMENLPTIPAPEPKILMSDDEQTIDLSRL